jgi:hypothetical protein
MSVAEAKAAMARAYASGEAPRLDSVSPDGMNEIWMLGGALFLLPVVPANAPAEVEYALRLRRDASLTGRCDMCDAAFDVEPVEDFETGSLSAGIFPHRGNCLAADENIFPLISSFYEKQRKTSRIEAFDAASKRTKEKALENLPNRIDIPATGKMKERFTGYLDQKLATAKGRCPHLESNPVQTWNIMMWDNTWRCDECALRFSVEYRQRPFLDPIEDHSCDYCRRYSPRFLQPTVSRVGTFLLYGAACRRCTQEFSGDESMETKA